MDWSEEWNDLKKKKKKKKKSQRITEASGRWNGDKRIFDGVGFHLNSEIIGRIRTNPEVDISEGVELIKTEGEIVWKEAEISSASMGAFTLTFEVD